MRRYGLIFPGGRENAMKAAARAARYLQEHDCAVAVEDAFEQSIDFFDWDRSRAFYMDLTHSLNPSLGNQDFIYAVSKTANKVFFKKIVRGDELYERGRQKYLELAFQYWLFT